MMFLTYQAVRLTAPETEAVAEHPELTKKYRRLIAGLTPDDEVNAFAVFTLPGLEGDARPWCGVRRYEGTTYDPPRLLFLASSDGRVYSSWQELPNIVKQRFRVVDSLSTSEESRYDLIGRAGLLDDW